VNERRVIVVANRLPVSVEYRNGRLTTRHTVGGLASALSAVASKRDILWLGWPGIATSDARLQAEITARLSAEFNCLPIFIKPSLFDRYYHGFSNNSLWPLFHYFSRLARYDAADWNAYRAVNQNFVDRLLEVAQPEDEIWVHDYQLMLMPALLRQRLPEAAIGFFLHIPFPSFELFREVPWRDHLLRGLLGADLVGFHTYDYMRHFLSALLRGLGLEADFGQVLVDGRVVRADTFPLGVDVAALAGAVRRARPPARGARSQRTILSVDRLDFTKGIPERLLAFERFLERYATWRGRVRLTLICVPSRTRVPAYQRLKRQVDEMVGSVNGRFSTPEWTPIRYLYRSFSTDELVQFYRDAEVALVTPLRDGMNLVAKEYLACRLDETGVLILSETAGAAAELGEALTVNPNDLDGMAAAIQAALTMPAAEQAARLRPLRERLARYDVNRWASDFLGVLEDTKRLQRSHRRRRLDGALRAELLAAYRSSQRRLLLLDYDGTLVPLAPLPDQAVPDEALRDLLRSLAQVPGNTVVVISGRDNHTLQRWLGGLGVVLVAEHGAWLYDAGHNWTLVDGAGATEWKPLVRPLLEAFVDRTPGAVVEEKALALAWHYRMADPELGALRAKELADTLGSLVANTSLQVLRGSKVLEVKDSTVGKGRAVQRWLQAGPDFTLAVGDDETDEDMFEALAPEAWSLRVGQSLQTRARFYVESPDEARSLLKDMVEGR
jgi:trehalose 6-phosphate synthase/phosphatase